MIVWMEDGGSSDCSRVRKDFGFREVSLDASEEFSDNFFFSLGRSWLLPRYLKRWGESESVEDPFYDPLIYAGDRQNRCRWSGLFFSQCRRVCGSWVLFVSGTDSSKNMHAISGLSGGAHIFMAEAHVTLSFGSGCK